MTDSRDDASEPGNGSATDGADAPTEEVDGPTGGDEEPLDVSVERFPTDEAEIAAWTRIEAIKTVYQLWSAENNIKTTKLYLYILTQSILTTAYLFGLGAAPVVTPFVEVRLPPVAIGIPIVGIISSVVSFVSIGRTLAFQKGWKRVRSDLLNHTDRPAADDFDFYPTEDTTDDAEHVHPWKSSFDMPWYGRLASKWVLLGPPILGLAIWLVVLVLGWP